MHYAKLSGILFCAIICGTLILKFYPTEQRVLNAKIEQYEKEVDSTTKNMESLREQRKKAEEDWKKLDNTLSWQINEWKEKVEKLNLCIEAKTLDCEWVDKKALVSFISPAFAEWTVTPASSGVPDWYQSKHEIVLSWSHDYREIYKNRSWAWWKNNNPSWLTWWVSDELKKLWKDNWVNYWKWTLRPVKEKWNYVMFATVEDGVKAKIIAVKERWKNATVSHYLWGWWTDDIKLSFDKSKKIYELSESEFAELFVQQIKKETPWYISQLVEDWIIVISN